MFGWLKPDPLKKLRKDYERLMSEAQALQRGGDIPAFAEKSKEAEDVLRKIEAMEAEQG